MNVELIAFTERGAEHAERLARSFGENDTVRISRGFGSRKVSLGAWTQEAFERADALVFVGAAGIAVRAIAPHARSKAHDPAVIVADEAGRWVIPLLSGHLGGANRLARRLAAAVGAQPVLTTATDVRGVWAADDWAAARGMAVPNPARIKAVSSRLLAGGRIRLASDVPLCGAPPEGVDVVSADEGAVDVLLSPFASGEEMDPEPLRLVPRRVRVGVGCRRGTTEQALASAVDRAVRMAGVASEAVGELRSVDLKRDEAGLAELAAHRGWATRFFSAEELAQVPGDFPASAFVERVAGVDNVCERAAAACGERVLLPKTVVDGVTVAVSLDEEPVSWNEEQ